MIPAAALLVLLGLGLFVAGIATGLTALYWLCVAACVAAGVVLALARRTMTADAAPSGSATSRGTTTATGEQTGHPRAPHAGATDVRAPGEEAGRAGDGRDGDGREGDGREGDGRPGRAAAGAPAEGAAPPGPEAGPPAAAEAAGPAAGVAPRHRSTPAAGGDHPREPPLEDVEVTDLLMVVDLRDEVLVVDEHPRYHLPGCRWLGGRETIPLPLDEARTDGFTPCGVCEPDRHLADLERSRRSGRGA